MPHIVPSSGSITMLISGVRRQEEIAAERLLGRLSTRVQGYARKLLSPYTRRLYDEDDATQSVMRSVCMALSAGRFSEVRDRDSLWALLATITARKISGRRRFDCRARRDVRRNVSMADLSEASMAGRDLESLSPALIAEFRDTKQFLLNQLGDRELAEIANLKLDGFNLAEISSQLEISRRTVIRRLAIIRHRWVQFAPGSDELQ